MADAADLAAGAGLAQDVARRRGERVAAEAVGAVAGAALDLAVFEIRFDGGHGLEGVAVGRVVNADGVVVGGIDGLVFGGWLYVKLLWVEASLRGRGHGTRLLRRMEEEAVRLGCTHAHLDTYSFEARPFYEKNGYEVFATLDDFPPGHQKHFLRKELT